MRIVFVILAVIGAAACQGDGAFWWLNKNLMKGAAESRSIKEQNAKIRTLPPRYRKESSEERPTTARNSIFVDEDEEDRKMFKYDSEPDCVCTPSYLEMGFLMRSKEGSGCMLCERRLELAGMGWWVFEGGRRLVEVKGQGERGQRVGGVKERMLKGAKMQDRCKPNSEGCNLHFPRRLDFISKINVRLTFNSSIAHQCKHR